MNEFFKGITTKVMGVFTAYPSITEAERTGIEEAITNAENAVKAEYDPKIAALNTEVETLKKGKETSEARVTELESSLTEKSAKATKWDEYEAKLGTAGAGGDAANAGEKAEQNDVDDYKALSEKHKYFKKTKN